MNEASRVAVLPNAPLAARNIPEVSFLLANAEAKAARSIGTSLQRTPTCCK